MDEAGAKSPHLDEEQKGQAAEHAPLRGIVIHEIIRAEGEADLKRPAHILLLSGLAAGLSMGFSFAVQAAFPLGLHLVQFRTKVLIRRAIHRELASPDAFLLDEALQFLIFQIQFMDLPIQRIHVHADVVDLDFLVGRRNIDSFRQLDTQFSERFDNFQDALSDRDQIRMILTEFT